jgi:predicted transcriptional regulator
MIAAAVAIDAPMIVVHCKTIRRGSTMPTITIRLDDETDARLKRRLEQSGQSLSAFVRAAVVTQLAAAPLEETAYNAWQRLIKDCPGSGETDRSMTYKARVKERLSAKHRR